MEASDALVSALATAERGDTRPLYALLCKGSRLPGPQPNLDLAESFARLSAGRGAQVDALLRRMVSLDADEAPGGTELEFLPMCGVTALGARAAGEAKSGGRTYEELLGLLHECAEDLRFRVRDAVPAALIRVGATRGAKLLDELAPWMDGYFHAAAVVRALGDATWLSSFATGAEPLQRIDEAFTLLREAPRAASRYPGHKALVEALGRGPALLMPRFGSEVFDLLARWALVQDPALRAIVSANLKGTTVRARFAADVTRVEAALAGSAKAPRDPSIIVHGTRKRGGGRRR